MRIYKEVNDEVYVTLREIRGDIVQLSAVHADGSELERGNILYIKDGEVYLNCCIEDTVINKLGLKVDMEDRIKLHNGDGKY